MPESSDVFEDIVVAERLANLQELTDSKLTQLDVDDLLVELLARVREILEVDTAAVLILDEPAGQLVARATCGIDEEVRQGVRVPLGTGFAGRIAATRQAVRLNRVDSTTVSNPLLWEKGIKTMLGVPLLRGDKVLGVLHVGRLQERPFSDEDIELLLVVGDRVTAAFETREHAIELAAAGCWNAACHRQGHRAARESSSRRATSPPKTAPSAVIGTTCSRRRRARCGSLLAMSPVTGWKRQSSWDACAVRSAPIPDRRFA